MLKEKMEKGGGKKKNDSNSESQFQHVALLLFSLDY